jgi:enoyl-CoA hydratase
MTDLIHFERHEHVAVLTLQHPPVNAFSLPVRGALLLALERAERDTRTRAIVLKGSGRGFSAGGDIREFGTPAVTATPRLTWDVHPAIEVSKKPIVAALHGFAMGGGLETALACHQRVAAADTIVALPEVTLGVIPLSATQRLPRLLSIERTLEVILTGAKFRADAFVAERLFDQLVPRMGALDDAARSLALRVAASGPPYPLVRNLPVTTAHAHAEQILTDARVRLEREAAPPAHLQAVAAIAEAVGSNDFDVGMRAANAICELLLASDDAKQSARRFLDG